MKRRWILSIDQGTTGTRSLLVDDAGQPASYSYRTHRQILPQPGWVEHDPLEIWRNVQLTIQQALRKAHLDASNLAGIGIANQGETVMAWDANTGTPVANAIVWQCNRTQRSVQRLKKHPIATRIPRLTGLVLDCYFSASKMRWLYQHVPECKRLARQKRLAMGTLDTWLIYKLTAGREFLTDGTTASRTLLMDLRKQQWDDSLLDAFEVDREWLPRIVPTIGNFGEAALSGTAVPILASAVDQQAALFGQSCFRAGEAKCTFGTGAFLLMHTGEQPKPSRHGLLTTVACSKPHASTFALDGGVYVAGAAVNWLRDSMGLVRNSHDTARVAASVADSGGLTFVPCFAGLAAPYWNREARGMLHGITAATTAAHVVRALLEGIALRVFTVAELMAKESGQPLRSPLRVDGGLSQNAFLMQFFADLLNLEVAVPECHETTSLGVAHMAGLGAGLFRDEADLAARWRAARIYQPSMPPDLRAEHIHRHRRAIRSVIAWNS